MEKKLDGFTIMHKDIPQMYVQWDGEGITYEDIRVR